MEWLGLSADEGPFRGKPDVGEVGPYYQMQRLAQYAELAEEMVAKGLAYRCTCTKEAVDAMRKAAAVRPPLFRIPASFVPWFVFARRLHILVLAPSHLCILW